MLGAAFSPSMTDMSASTARDAFAPRGTLRATERMRAGAEFRETYDTGRALHGRSLVMFCLRRDDGGRHVGFVTSRKVGEAVVRNRVRRRLREAYRAVREGMPPHLLLVCVARKGAHLRDAADLADEMRGLLSRLDSPEPPRVESRSARPARGKRGAGTSRTTASGGAQS